MESTTQRTFATARVDDLRGLVERQGPFLSLAMTTVGDVEGAGLQNQARLADLRVELESAGAPAELLDAVAAELDGAHQLSPGLVVVGDASGLEVVEHAVEAPSSDWARWAALPSLVALVEARQSAVPHVLVRIDRTGADVSLIPAGGARRELTVEGSAGKASKVHAGGWSHRRFQQRADDAWDRNAHDVADAVAEAAHRMHARLIVIAGDDRAAHLLLGRLPQDLDAQLVPGGRGNDGSDEEVEAQARTLARTEGAAATKAALETFRERRAHGLAVEGRADTLSALAAAQVDVLLVHDDPSDETGALYAEQANVVAADEAGFDAVGAQVAGIGRLPDVAVRAALATGADIRVIPAHGGPEGGIGALLRWAR